VSAWRSKAAPERRHGALCNHHTKRLEGGADLAHGHVGLDKDGLLLSVDVDNVAQLVGGDAGHGLLVLAHTQGHGKPAWGVGWGGR
jgi:hypothetical protein